MESGGTDTDTDDGNCAQLTTPPAENQETDVDAFEYGDLDPPYCTPRSTDESAVTEEPAVPVVQLQAHQPTQSPAMQHRQRQPPRQKRKSSSAVDFGALLDEQRLLREDLRAARAKEFELRERQIKMQEKLYSSMSRYFDRH
ncbi:uncharacterized protein LOC144165008 [Haemaphysalis longicornis]